MILNENLFEDYSEPTDIGYKIKYQLDDKVNEIFADFQNDMGIESGDITPMLSLELERAEENLSDVIKKGLYAQMGYYPDEYDESLNESEDDDEEYDETDKRYYVVSYYGNSRRGREDDLFTDDFEEVKDWVWEKIQRGNYINVTDADNGNDINLNPSDYDFESDDAYRVFDDLDRISPLRSDSLHESKEGAKN